MWLHAHVGFWTLALILFIISFLLLKAGKGKAQKITHMILRLDLLLVLVTGIKLVSTYYSFGTFGWPTVKGLFGLLLITMMEMILTRGSKGKSTGVFWVLLIISLLAVFYIGYVRLG